MPSGQAYPLTPSGKRSCGVLDHAYGDAGGVARARAPEASGVDDWACSAIVARGSWNDVCDWFATGAGRVPFEGSGARGPELLYVESRQVATAAFTLVEVVLPGVFLQNISACFSFGRGRWHLFVGFGAHARGEQIFTVTEVEGPQRGRLFGVPSGG